MTSPVAMPRPRAAWEHLDGRPPAAPEGLRAAPDPTGLWGPTAPENAQEPRTTWREQVLIRADELAGLADWMDGGTSGTMLRPPDAILATATQAHLENARDAARGTSGNHGARMERAVGHLDAAEALLLRRSPDDYLRGELPWLLAHVQAHLPPTHPQRVSVQAVSARAATQPAPLTEVERNALVEAARAASWAERRENTRLRSFRTAILLTAGGLFVLATAIAVVGAVQPRWMPLCFAPQGANAVVCPTGTGSTGTGTATATQIASVTGGTVHSVDIALVMLIGLAGAAVTSAAALRRLRGTSTPFAVPATLLMLKVPTGMLTAFLGLLLLHGNFVPGLSALDSSDQILAWALVFGAAQQLVTGLVDKKAQSVLDSVGSTPMTAEHE